MQLLKGRPETGKDAADIITLSLCPGLRFPFERNYPNPNPYPYHTHLLFPTSALRFWTCQSPTRTTSNDSAAVSRHAVG